jgi:hypothetical protein
MARKHKADPFKSISSTDLDSVTGGRLSIKKGPDPQLVAGIKQLGETINAVGQKMTADKAASSQQMMGMMQQMMGGRR